MRNWVRRGNNEGDDKWGLSLLKFFAVASPQAWDSYYKDARREGREEGRDEERKEMAKAMLSEGFPLEKVSHITGFSEKEIRSF